VRRREPIVVPVLDHFHPWSRIGADGSLSSEPFRNDRMSVVRLVARIAIPAFLDMLAIEGAIVTIDAMGCQRNIAQKILDKKADYIFSLKGNQSSLREDVELFAAEQKANGFRDTKITHYKLGAALSAVSASAFAVYVDRVLSCSSIMAI